MPSALGLREICERFERCKHLGHKQAPQAVVGIVLAHVRRRGQQQNVRRRPAQGPACITGRQTSQGLGKLIPIGLANVRTSVAVSSQLVSFVEHDKIKRPRSTQSRCITHAPKHAFSGQRINAHDDAVTPWTCEGVPGMSIGAANDAKREAEQYTHFSFPVANQPSWHYHQHALYCPSYEHLAQIEPRHDCLSRTGVVGKKKP